MARSSATPCQTPSRLPSRQSNRIRTSSQSASNFVRPSQDSRRSITHPTCTPEPFPNHESEIDSSPQSTQPSKKTSKKRTQNLSSTHQTPASKHKSKHKKKNMVIDSNEGDGVIDLAQDSDAANFKVRQPNNKKPSPLDNIRDYFGQAYHANITDTGEKLMFKCKWCAHPYKKGKKTNSNLYTHRDGAANRTPCPARSEAIASGAILPPTVKEAEIKEEKHQLGTMRAYLKHAPFDNRVFNQLLVMWLIRFSLPWNRIKDFLLHVAFNYTRRGLHIHTRVWAATEAHRLYLNLQGKLIASLKNLSSKFTLIHDIWTTKGNHHAFMGISVGYVTDDWTFHISHLGLKYIASNHKGKLLAIPFANILVKSQTTDSGSNNFTMASEVDRLIIKKTGIDPNLSENHIRCFCHKLALIINAGLQSMKLSPEELIPLKESTLGFAPGLCPIAEESEEIETRDQFVQEDVVLDEEDLQIRTKDTDDESPEESSLGPNKVDGILVKVDFIIQRITSSTAKRSEYDTWCVKLEHNGPSLIAGYGIRWNIKFQSRDAGYQAREEHEGGKNYYSNLEITENEWDVVNKLNNILSEFYYLTKAMEGDHSSGCLMISKYRQIKESIKKKMRTASEPQFKQMLQTMTTKTDKYLEEALNCDAILIATVLNPSFRLSILKVSFPSHYDYTLQLLTSLFNTRKAERDMVIASQEPTHPVGKQPDPRELSPEEIDYFPETTAEETAADELSIYLGGKYNHLHLRQTLTWDGGRREHCQEFPILALLARDYLACSGTSASVERCFLAAADTCSRDRGSLAAKTIERCVSSHQWLVQGVEPDGNFEISQGIITQATEEENHKKQKKEAVAALE
ncbi:hypothetical protein MJO29_009478 [Puccinia striiformis f. sp. tritici]|nr:hypothetical protein MJO29_009478 [Puccinia striiformis f. sp. tritici]